MEIYKVAFENYEISNFGNCRRKCKNGDYKVVRGSITNKGYRYLQIKRNKKRINHCFHQLVYKAFIGEVENGKEIDHIDRNKLNNNLENLRAVSHIENLHNTDNYRNDVIETDKIKRRNILQKERDTRKRREKGCPERKKKGEGFISSKLKWRLKPYYARITINKIRYSEYFETEEKAKEYLEIIKKKYQSNA